jgi:ATP-dependent DNA helicase RecQ
VQVLEGLRGQSVIVYAPRRDDTVRIASLLRAANHSARSYHAGMEPPARANVEEAFRYGEIDVVLATKAFGLGIDKPDVHAVVHLEMPASVEEYVQETGRAARGASSGDGPERGWCVLLSAPRDCGIHAQFAKSAAPTLDVVQAVWRQLGPTTSLVLPDDLATSAGLGPRDTDSVDLAVHHLVLAGALRRREDVMWAGRVWIPSDVESLLDDLEKHDSQLARRGRELIARIATLGTEEYDAPGWSRRLGIPAPDLEEALLELNRRDVIGLSAWRFAWQLERVEGIEPDWAAIGERCNQRAKLVGDLSIAAKRYARQDRQCRRAWLLGYLGAATDDKCGACDVCVPDVEKPWAGVDVTADDIAQALPARQIWMALLLDVDGRGYAIGTLVHALTGTGRYTSDFLKEHPTFVRLKLLGVERTRSELDRIIAEELAEVVELEHDGRTYTSVRLTAQGRAWR